MASQLNPDDLLKVDNFMCFALYSAGHAFTRLYKPLLDPLGLTYPQYLVMAVLWEKDDRPVGEIGEKLLLESSTLTPLLKRLEAAGMVRRTRDRDDERVVRIQLTPQGATLKQKALSIPAAIGCSTSLSIPEVVKLTGEIKALRQKLLAAQAA
ncbi:MarR family transcriptional regulator [Bradyrhizobium sp. G127]|uniref:MarR family winged helix-turn-helix transcriptional regulator n=1 Tax=Bradyrhizobium sp. G127 TaxID=2904800 RepID=UPI001F19A9F4|nr:MarR family transcriptional regulator [Bradyrhizobium sp. G127]MCF2525604.1 MarR family transcriptional regulator [Bradyrhizobium sp. G127]